MPSQPRGIADDPDETEKFDHPDGPVIRIAAGVGMLLIDAAVLGIGTFYLGIDQGLGFPPTDLHRRQHHALVVLAVVGAILVLAAVVAVANRWTGAAWLQAAVIAVAALWAFTVWPKHPPAPVPPNAPSPSGPVCYSGGGCSLDGTPLPPGFHP